MSRRLRVAGIVAAWILISFSFGCMQTENSSTLDAEIYAGGGSPEFIAAKAIFTQSCNGPCHHHNYHAQTQAQIVSSGAVVPGDPLNSPLYYRLRGTTGGPSNPNKNMPDGASALTPDEIATISNWIQGI